MPVTFVGAEGAPTWVYDLVAVNPNCPSGDGLSNLEFGLTEILYVTPYWNPVIFILVEVVVVSENTTVELSALAADTTYEFALLPDHENVAELTPILVGAAIVADEGQNIFCLLYEELLPNRGDGSPDPE